ncbi:MAG: enoyl-CoA hydratase/isomerase family protein [Acidobacteriota bacterium]
MAEDSRAIVTKVDEAIAVIRFNKPRERNPLSRQILLDLKITLSEITVRNDVGAIIFTGTNDVFASGANIRELAQLEPTSALEFSRLGRHLFQAIADARQLTIASINGYCMGGALDLALACDIRVASTNAVLAHPGVRLGIITGWGGTQRLPRLIQKKSALELLLTGRRILAEEALNLGLVTAVSEQSLETSRLMARSATLNLQSSMRR